MGKCKDCKWWKERRDESYKGDKIGVCHKLPPIPNPYNSVGMFPKIIMDSWCGGFKAKEIKPSPGSHA